MDEREMIRETMCRILERPVDSLSDDIELDTVGDSLDLIELIFELQDELGVSLTQDDFAGKGTVGDFITLFAECIAAQNPATATEA